MKQNQIGLQLYTVRERTAEDMLGTLRHLIEMGYRNFEFAGYGNATPRAISALLKELGGRAISAHVRLAELETRTEQVFEELQLLGCSHVVVPWVPEEQRASVAAVSRLAESINQMAVRARQAGLRMGYHNHNFEFAPVEGTTMWDVLTGALDPQLVDLELDVYWAEVAGYDSVELIRQHGSRISLLHMKDMANDESRADRPVGEGSIAWRPILEEAVGVNAQWYIVEQDHPDDPLDCVRRALVNLSALAQ